MEVVRSFVDYCRTPVLPYQKVRRLRRSLAAAAAAATTAVPPAGRTPTTARSLGRAATSRAAAGGCTRPCAPSSWACCSLRCLAARHGTLRLPTATALPWRC